MYFLHAISSDRQTRLLNVLGQIAVILGDKKNIRKFYNHAVLIINTEVTVLSTCQ